MRDYQKLKEFLIKRNSNKIEKSGEFVFRKEPEKREEGTSLKDNEIILRIALNSRSPIQDDAFGTWDEIININCFDKSINEDTIYSFLDHKIDIEHTLASTANQTMRINKVDEFYEAKIILDTTNNLALKLLNDVKNGIVNSNSFIFVPEETEYIENWKKKDFNPETMADITIIHKSAKLLSIDPVIIPFYPQNKISKGEQMENKEYRDASPKVEQLDNDNNDINYWKDKVKALETKLEEMKKQTTKDVNDEADKSQISSKKDTKNDINSEGENIDGKDESFDANKKSNIQTKKDEELEEEKETPEDKEEQEERSNILLRRKEINKFMNNQKNNLPEMRYSDIVKKLEKRFTKNANIFNENILNSEEKNCINSKLEEYRAIDPNFEKEINLVSPSIFLSRGIDGSSLEKGLAYISYINDPEVKAELVRVFPETDGADFINLETLDEVKKDILLPSNAVVTNSTEGSAASEHVNKTISVSFKPTRYNQEIEINPVLANSSQVYEKQTLNTKNAITTALRKAFYANMFKNVEVELNTLISSNKYDGGLTKEAIIGTQDNNKLTLADLDSLINNIEAVYGDGAAKDEFKIYMHPNTRSYVFGEARKLYNGTWVANEENNTYRGVKVITSNNYPNSVKPDGTFDETVSGGTDTNKTKPVVVFARKDMITARGLNVITEDNPWIKMSEGLLVRYIRTRGEVKLTDPCINSKAITIGASAIYKQTGFKLEKEEPKDQSVISKIADKIKK